MAFFYAWNISFGQTKATKSFIKSPSTEGSFTMKLTNLSLAIMVAVGVAACGGSDDNNGNQPADPPKPNNPQNNNNNQPTPPADNPHVVDPTGTQVVDDKDLTKQNTVGPLQYIRRDGSRYDRQINPSQPASASPLLGTSLNEQNPSLTNIVLARQEVVRTDGTPVKAQFTGSDNPNPLQADGTAIKDSVKSQNSLQEENFNHVDVLAGMYARNENNIDGKHTDDANNVDDKNKINRVANNLGLAINPVARTAQTIGYVMTFGDVDRNGKRIPSIGFARQYVTGDKLATATDAGLVKGGSDKVATKVTAIMDPVKWQKNLTSPVVTGKDDDGKDVYTYRAGRGDNVDGFKFGTTVVSAEAANAASGTLSGTRYGKGLVWWSAPETAFENWVSRGNSEAGRTAGSYDLKQSAKTNSAAGALVGADMTGKNSDAATNGLVRIGGGLSTLGQELNYNKDEKKWEDHHKTSSRIFGRYHLAYAGQTDKTKGVHQVAQNSFSGAKSFVAEVENTASNTPGTKATQYSLGAQPTTLKYVQYGRVTTNLDLDEGEKGYPDGFVRNPYGKKGDDNTVDDYFYRGTDATTIEQMAALPSDQKATYNGHALMYGIDNDYHGGSNRNLPNAFAGATTGLGLGNFVEARVDFGQKRVLGEVYNEWLLDPAKSTTTRDNLVRFQGNIIGNTVVGTADRNYIAGDDGATFKASFFGEKAEEMGGSFNSVKDADKYGPAYGQNDWGGVFGASKGGSGNTFQGDDGSNQYEQNSYDK